MVDSSKHFPAQIVAKYAGSTKEGYEIFAEDELEYAVLTELEKVLYGLPIETV